MVILDFLDDQINSYFSMAYGLMIEGGVAEISQSWGNVEMLSAFVALPAGVIDAQRRMARTISLDNLNYRFY